MITRRHFLKNTLGLASLGLFGCQPSHHATNPHPDNEHSTEPSTTLSNKERKKRLHIYNWVEYLSNDVINAFSEQTGIEVIVSGYDSNEAMYAKVKLLQDNVDYDLILPATDFVNKMRREGLLLPLDFDKLPNFHHLSKDFLNREFDPDNQYSVPYLLGHTGLVFNSQKIAKGVLTSWDDLWQPAYRGRVMLINEMRDVFAMALLTLGFDGNTTDPNHIKQAFDKLTTLMPNVRTFNSDSPRMPFWEGETYLGLCWNGEVIFGHDEGMSELDFAYPKEGVLLGMDSFVIPKNAKNPDAAHQFINFLLEPEMASINAQEIGFTTPNLSAIKLLPPELSGNIIAYPTSAHLKNALFREDVGDDTLALYQKYWDMLKVM